MKRMYLLYNPKSGRENFKHSLGDIIEAFSQEGYEVTVHSTAFAGEATEIAERLSDEYDVLVCGGGDGTLNETLTGNLRREKPLMLGYIPCGSTNDFGNTIYGSSANTMQVVERIAKGRVHEVDCGKLAEKTFVYTAAFGVFTDVSYETPHSAKAVLGHAAYVLEAAKSLGNIKAHQVKVVINGEEEIVGSFLIGMVTNADTIGGIQNILGKDISLHDGELELTMVIQPEKSGDFGKALQALLDGSQNDQVIRRKVKSVRFVFEEPVSFTMDGEFGGTFESVDIQCLPSAFSLIY